MEDLLLHERKLQLMCLPTAVQKGGKDWKPSDARLLGNMFAVIKAMLSTFHI